MTAEVLEALHIDNQAKYIDATLGSGGHSLEIIKKGGIVLGIDEDPEILKIALNRMEEACPVLNLRIEDRFKGVLGNFKDIDRIAQSNGFSRVSGILFDLGVNNLQLTSGQRGFSFSNSDAPLDMRINQSIQAVKAADLLNVLSEKHLIKLFAVTLSLNYARRLAKKVVERRQIKPFETVGDLILIADPVSNKRHLHPATLPLLALRIAVNSELDNLEEAIKKGFDLLKPGGKLVVISFHSKEDEIVKTFFKGKEKEGNEVLYKEPLTPSDNEIMDNPRSRSARLRVLIKKYDS
ncbi:16S rRNA (cytosine(1402)-N(4))-methyltransferase RsmH [Candidatus Woesebacteria bacterium]|nr:16S rRNA (cytosine(1402)-N(4))-methyltransferase RsmH [Candidatus Woesebacteria bacterium]